MDNYARQREGQVQRPSLLANSAATRNSLRVLSCFSVIAASSASLHTLLAVRKKCLK